MIDKDTFNAIASAVAKVTAKLEADIYVFYGDVVTPNDWAFQTLLYRPRRKNVLLLINTLGGQADSAYRIARAFQRHYFDGNKMLLISIVCKSAGTLIALGADELIMSDVAEIGPLDVQLSKPDEIGERTSGLTPIQALTSLQTEVFHAFERFLLDLRSSSRAQLSTKLSAEIATKLVTGLFGGIYNQLDPLRFGENQRHLQIAEEYGTRLATNGRFNNLKPDALSKLVVKYPSHGFIIDASEAQTLFHKVRPPTEEEDDLRFSLTGIELGFARNGRHFIKYLSPDRVELAKELGYTEPETKHDADNTPNDGSHQETTGSSGASSSGHDSTHPSGGEESPGTKPPNIPNEHTTKTEPTV